MKVPREPYLAVVDPRIQMAGKGAPRSTVFGVLGRTMDGGDVGVKSLGGLVKDTKSKAKHVKETIPERKAPQTDKKIIGPPAKTRIPGAHYGQVPFCGFFLSAVGHRLA